MAKDDQKADPAPAPEAPAAEPAKTMSVLILRGYQPMTEGAEFIREDATTDLPEVEAKKLVRIGAATFPED